MLLTSKSSLDNNISALKMLHFLAADSHNGTGFQLEKSRKKIKFICRVFD